MFDFLDRPIPSWSEIKDAYHKKHHPIKYVTEQYVSEFDKIENPTAAQFNSAAKTLKDLGEAEKNYTNNNPGPGIIRTSIAGLISLLGIASIINAEKEDIFPTKAWSFVPKIGGKKDD